MVEDRGQASVRLVVLYGGRSAEHEVSCISALHVLRAARAERYDVRLIGITSDGRWIDATDAQAEIGPTSIALTSPDALVTRLGAPPPQAKEPTTGALTHEAAIAPLGADSQMADSHMADSQMADSQMADSQMADSQMADSQMGGSQMGGSQMGSFRRAGSRLVDPLRTVTASGDAPIVVLPLLHGPMGEDGTVQGLLEVAGVPYVGAGVLGSAVAMDKGVAKALLAAAGLPQVRHLVRRENEIDELLAKTVEADLGWPVFVKPANLGSSIGISRVKDAGELTEAVALATRFDEYVVIEESVDGREIEVAILGNRSLRASVPGEVIPSRPFYDFEDKYLVDGAELRIPADLPPQVAATVRDMAIRAGRALRIDGMARVDFFYEEHGRGLLINEVNTIPGFTPISMYPRLWQASGLSYAELVDELVELALQRHARRSRFETRRG